MRRYKRIIASILLVAALMTLMPPVTAVEEGAIRVITGTEVSVSLAGSTLVQVETELTETLRWQIYSPEYEVWADISGKTGTSCEVSYAMICNALDNAGIAKLRCAAGEAVSPTVTVRVDYDAQYVSAAPVMLSDADEPTEAVEDTEPATVSEDTEIIGVDDCIVEVQFLYYSTQQPAAASWTARVSTGSSHTLEVTLPKVMGYAPFYQGHKITSEKLTITTDVLEGDTTYVVYFQAADVQYTVVHHQQNVDNDNYISVLTETLMGPTDSLVGMVEKNYAGFTALLYEHPAIAADGSTVVDIYYDREYYLMNFILGEGGYGVYPLFARYDAAVDVGTPVRAGYTFQGWEPALPATVPAQNTSYTALWKVNDKAQVTIVIWGENPNDEHYAYLGSQVISAVPGTILTYTSYGLMTCGKQEHVHNENCVLLCDKIAHVHSGACCTRDEHTSNADCCTVPEHDHVVACWGNLAGEQANPSNAPDDAQQGQIYRHWSRGDGYVYYIYIGESWYVYNGTPSGTLVHSSCGMAEHTHGDGGCSCEDVHTHGDGACVYCKQDLVEHIHVDDCYDTSDLDAHVHIDSCYEDILSSYVDSTLYYYVHSEQITVEADGSSVLDVYFDRTEFTMTFKETDKNGGETLGTIQAKWGAYIRDEFQAISSAYTFLWSEKSGGGSPWTSFVNVMPPENRTYYEYISTSGSLQGATYYGEVVGTPSGETVTVNGVTYEVLYTTSVRYNSRLTVSEEEFETIEGYAFNAQISTKEGAAYADSKFYYDREIFEVDFSDGYNVVRSGQVDYGNSLQEFADYTPDIPMALDKNGYYFDGWYLNPECSGERFDLAASTMPAKDLILYAKWSPKIHTVTFYRDSTLTELLGTYQVLHGQHLTQYPESVTNGSYEFLYWFYEDSENGENAFDPVNMAIYQDMQVYAKWNSNAMRPYIIHYAIEGSDIEIGASTVWVADLSEGSGLVGTTKTFEAKGPEELYDGYQHHYFPLVRSHSFVLSLDGENEYTFKYVPREVIPYTVRYVDEKGNDLAEPKVVSENTHAVVTETSIGISGYKADAYQKRLIVVADETLKDTNVITFVYTKVEGEHAREFYGISHYIQTLNGGWMEYQYSEDIGDIGMTQIATPISPADLPGFTYDESISTPSGILALGGIHLQLYYKRNSYPYTIYYLDSENENAEPLQIITGSALYESMVTGNAIAIDGYELVGEGTKSITIRVDTATDENGTPLNQIIFYYRKKTTEFKYEVVGPVGCGTVSIGAERVTADGTGIQPTGSQALAAHGYQFVGWFKDAEGLYPVDDTEGSLSGDGSHFVPGIKNGAYTGRTYYAKFAESLTSLTISKTGSSDLDEDQSFLFRVYSAEQGIDVTVAILGNNSVTIKELPIGTYSITELTGWSWRYTPDQPERSVEVKAGQDNSISFANSRTGLYWLDGNDSRENTFQ